MQIGERYHRLVVVRLIPDSRNPKAECLCDCGKSTVTVRASLRRGKAKSCGCFRVEMFKKRIKTHGLSKTRTFKIFCGMKARCSNKNLPEYKNYGGRGIKVIWSCFEDFLKDMGMAPEGYWIDRVDNNGNYEKGNCVWSKPQENQVNKRVSKYWFINGVKYESSVEAAKVLGVSPSVVVRGCNGFSKNGRYHSPRKGWHCELKY